jgi:Holliday junction resolvase RusA-like endonuclease
MSGVLLSFNVPLFITLGVNKKKNYWLNLNGYRNWQYHLSNNLKKEFKRLVYIPDIDQIESKVRISYTFFYPDKTKRDIDNSLAVVSKFTSDALVESNILGEDNYEYVISVKGEYGGIDKENPRCEVKIYGVE